jgi:hypothetical protein
MGAIVRPGGAADDLTGTGAVYQRPVLPSAACIERWVECQFLIQPPLKENDHEKDICYTWAGHNDKRIIV